MYTPTYIIGKSYQESSDKIAYLKRRIIKTVDVLLKEALLGRMDSINFICQENGKAICRFARKGSLFGKRIFDPYQPILDRLKIIFGLDITEHRVPQRYEPIRIFMKNQKILCKALMETFPGEFGESSRLTFIYEMESSFNIQ